ncbi:MAG: hypothetical protein ACR2J7_03360 [Luteimonas sp.]
MSRITPSRSLPFPPWLLAADVLATALLASGLLILFVPEAGSALPAIAASRPLGWTLVVLGAAGMLAWSVALFSQLRARHASRHP